MMIKKSKTGESKKRKPAAVPDATLENWLIFNDQAHGQVYGDRKGRFEDGHFITTSLIRKATKDGLIVTCNSVYKLGNKFQIPTEWESQATMKEIIAFLCWVSEQEKESD